MAQSRRQARTPADPRGALQMPAVSVAPSMANGTDKYGRTPHPSGGPCYFGGAYRNAAEASPNTIGPITLSPHIALSQVVRSSAWPGDRWVLMLQDDLDISPFIQLGKLRITIVIMWDGYRPYEETFDVRKWQEGNANRAGLLAAVAVAWENFRIRAARVPCTEPEYDVRYYNPAGLFATRLDHLGGSTFSPVFAYETKKARRME